MLCRKQSLEKVKSPVATTNRKGGTITGSGGIMSRGPEKPGKRMMDGIARGRGLL